MLKITNGIFVFLLGLALGFRAEALMPTDATIYSNIAFTLAGLFAFLSFLIWRSKYIWPNRERWIAEFIHGSTVIRTLELQNTLSKDSRCFWVSPEPQAEGDIYKIDFGKDRVIAGIEFIEQSPSNEFPYSWRLAFLGKQGNILRRHIQYEGKRIDVKFSPIKVRAIEVTVRKPMNNENGMPYHWRIEDVYFWEAKVFKKLLMKI